MMLTFPRFSGRKNRSEQQPLLFIRMWPCAEKTDNRFTVAGTVYESHVLPYSPAFKPAPVIKERTVQRDYKYFCDENKQ